MPENPPAIAPASTRAVIEGSVKTALSAVPIVGGAIVQAWSEYTGYKRDQRIQEFVGQVVAAIGTVEEEQQRLKENLAQMPDAAEILERSIEAASREVSAVKRELYSRAYVSFLRAPGNTTPAERVTFIQEIEQLAENDIQTLARFRGGRALRGDQLTNTVDPGFGPMSGHGPRQDWRAQHAPLISSLQRLEARGLLMEAHINASSMTAGGEDPGFTRFRMRGWQPTLLGIKLLGTLA